MSFYRWFVYGDVDWEYWGSTARQYCPTLSGAVFGAAWWVFVDALVVSDKVPIIYHLPGWIATLSLVLMNMLSRDELAQSRDAYEEAAECRARTWLFFAYVVATAAVATGVVLLVKQADNLEHAAVGALLQACLIVLSSLLLWAFRTEDSSGYGGYGFIA